MPKNNIVDTLKKGFAAPKKNEIVACLHCLEIECSVRENCIDNERQIQGELKN